MTRELKRYHYAWHYFVQVWLLSSVILTPITVWYCYNHALAWQSTLAYCVVASAVPLLFYVDTEVSWSHRVAPSRTLSEN